MSEREEMLDLDEAGVDAAVRECARITAPEIDDAKFAEIKAENSPRYRNTKSEMERTIRAYLSAATPAPGYAENQAEENRIDRLRLTCFKSNDPKDRQAYFDAASKWFQDRHYRRMDAERAALPAPGGESVTVEELAQLARDTDLAQGQCLETDDVESYEPIARALLSRFTILTKSEHGGGS